MMSGYDRDEWTPEVPWWTRLIFAAFAVLFIVGMMGWVFV